MFGEGLILAKLESLEPLWWNKFSATRLLFAPVKTIFSGNFAMYKYFTNHPLYDQIVLAGILSVLKMLTESKSPFRFSFPLFA